MRFPITLFLLAIAFLSCASSTTATLTRTQKFSLDHTTHDHNNPSQEFIGNAPMRNPQNRFFQSDIGSDSEGGLATPTPGIAFGASGSTNRSDKGMEAETEEEEPEGQPIA